MIKNILLALLEMDAEVITAKTGQKAKVSGVYRSRKEFICLSAGETFIPSETMIWTLVVSV